MSRKIKEFAALFGAGLLAVAAASGLGGRDAGAQLLEIEHPKLSVDHQCHQVVVAPAWVEIGDGVEAMAAEQEEAVRGVEEVVQSAAAGHDVPTDVAGYMVVTGPAEESVIAPSPMT